MFNIVAYGYCNFTLFRSNDISYAHVNWYKKVKDLKLQVHQQAENKHL